MAYYVEPFETGPQKYKRFADFSEAFNYAHIMARSTKRAWAIFGPDHELDTTVHPDEKKIERRA